MRNTISKIIRGAINDHLVMHIQTDKGDTRDRIDIVVEQCKNEINVLIERDAIDFHNWIIRNEKDWIQDINEELYHEYQSTKNK